MEEKSKILIVDDKHENLVALETILDDFDIDIIRAYSGNEALTKTLENEFALALVDVQMPDMDGYETVKLMRAVDRTKLLPVIFISAIHSQDEYIQQGLEAGAVDFLTKPIRPKLLQGKVQIFLDLYNQKNELKKEIEKRIKYERDLKNIQQDLELAKQKAEDTDKLKTTFLANMSHEIRTPMNAIIGFSNLLASEDLSAEEKESYIQYIKNSSQELLNLINDIIDISKIEAGQLTISKSVFNIHELLHELHATYKEELEVRNKKNVKLELILPEGIEKFTMITDIHRLRQVYTNLVNNALKFTKEGTVSYGYSLSKEGNVAFFVEDTGVGIPEDKLTLIFQRFGQVDHEGIDNQSGTGLGLTITKRIVQLLGGNIQVTSKVNEGTKFCFSLPVNDQSTEMENIREEKINVKLNRNASQSDLRGHNILIAEDEMINYLFMKEVFRKHGIEHVWAKNGKEAVEIMKTNPQIELVLMDLKMPEMTGEAAMQIIKNTHPKIPVIAQTAYAMVGEREKFLRLGFDEYVTKPINIPHLLELLSRFFSLMSVK